MLTHIFGECAQVKLIDFLLNHPWSDFSKTELAEGADIARPTLYKLLKILLDEDMIIETKKVGNIQLYRTNRKSPIIQRISQFKGSLEEIEQKSYPKSG
jgi:DNA-binding transcriptional ArsR family regulator